MNQLLYLFWEGLKFLCPFTLKLGSELGKRTMFWFRRVLIELFELDLVFLIILEGSIEKLSDHMNFFNNII